MALPLPDLDDYTYAQLVEEARNRIPAECPEWTDHNPTDTGIILIELLAWFTELALYRVNQIPDQNRVTFLRLLKGEAGTLNANPSLKQATQTTLQELTRRHRAVSPHDFEQLVLKDWNAEKAATLGRIERVFCFPQRNLEQPNLEHPDLDAEAPAHISVVIVPQQATQFAQIQPDLLAFLNQRRLLTTRLHVVPCQSKQVALEKVVLVLQQDANPGTVRQTAIQQMNDFFSPYDSGQYWQGKGWPLGRSIYLSELYTLLDEIDGVDYVEQIELNPALDASQEITLEANQLVELTANEQNFELKVRIGNVWKSF